MDNFVFDRDNMKWLVKSAYSKITKSLVSEFCDINKIPNDNRLKICFVVAKNAGGVGYYRAIQPAKYLNQIFGDKCIAIVTHDPSPELIMGWADILVMGRAFDPVLYILTKRTKAITVYETDDLLHCVDPENPAYQHWNEESGEFWWATEQLEVCKAVQTSTQPLLDIYKQPGQKGAVLENMIDPDLFPVKPRRDSKPIRIGWAGSQTHIIDLAVVGPTLLKLHKEHEYREDLQFVFMGFSGEYDTASDGKRRDVLLKIPREYHEGVPIRSGKYYQALADLDLDIAIAPLADTPFNLCKSNIKTLEFGALGIPMVVSGVGPYLWFEQSPILSQGIATQPLGWYWLLKNLIKNAGDRRLLGDTLKFRVEQDYDIKKRIHEYYDFYRSL